MKFSVQNSAFLSTKKETVGFTLIELLVVVSLITIMTGALIPSFNTYLDDQNIKQAQEAVKNDLRSAQNKALSGSLTSDPNVKYWGLKFTSNTNTYSYFTSSNTTCSTVVPQTTSQPLPGSVLLRSTGCIFFSVANGDGSGVANIYVGEFGTTGNKCRSITISTNGLIVAFQGKVACP